MVFLSQGKADPLYISWMSFHAVATLPSPLVGALAHWDIFWMGFNMQTCFIEVFLQWSLMLIHELTLDNCPSHPQCRCHTTMFTAPLFNVRKVIAKHEYSNMTRLPLWENKTFTSVLDIHTYIHRKFSLDLDQALRSSLNVITPLPCSVNSSLFDPTWPLCPWLFIIYFQFSHFLSFRLVLPSGQLNINKTIEWSVYCLTRIIRVQGLRRVLAIIKIEMITSISKSNINNIRRVKGQTASNLTSIMLRSLLLELLKCAPALKPSNFSWEHTSWRWATNRGEAPLSTQLLPLAPGQVTLGS